MKKILILTMALGMLGMLGCGPILPDGVPSCSEALTNFFDQGCEWLDDRGIPEIPEETIQGCEEYIAHISSREGNTCLVFTIDTLFCLHSLDKKDSCNSCDDELNMIQGCMPEDD